MNIEFHFYAIHHLCVQAGLSPREAETVAGSSQLVDEMLQPLDIRAGEACFHMRATQNYRFWNDSIRRHVYMPFHFIPGDPSRAEAERADGWSEPGIVTEDSPNARSLLVDAFRSQNLFRIGIALHAYADTWAHQHFSANAGRANIVDPNSLLPPAGHLQVLSAPDDPGITWEDGRLVPPLRRVVNSERFMTAARKIYRFICTWRRRSFIDEDYILEGLSRIWSAKTAGIRGGAARTARMGAYIVDLGVPPREAGLWLLEAGIPSPQGADDPFSSGYNKREWIRSALPGALFGTRMDGSGEEEGGARTHYVDRDRYEASRLHAWNEAAEAHLSVATALLSTGGRI